MRRYLAVIAVIIAAFWGRSASAQVSSGTLFPSGDATIYSESSVSTKNDLAFTVLNFCWRLSICTSSTSYTGGFFDNMAQTSR